MFTPLRLHLPPLLLALCMTFAQQALADIYVNDGVIEDADAAEIHLSNMPSEDADQLLIAEALPQMPAPAVAPDMLSDTSNSLPFAEAVSAAAKESALEPALLHAVIAAESNHNPRAVSPRGAQGLMQLMPATARRLHLNNPFDPVQNVRAGALYLKELKDMFKGDLNLTLAAYNAGPGAVVRYGSRIPPYAETRRYVPKVLNLYRALSRKSM